MGMEKTDHYWNLPKKDPVDLLLIIFHMRKDKVGNLGKQFTILESIYTTNTITYQSGKISGGNDSGRHVFLLL